MSTDMYLKVTYATEFLLTYVTWKPSAFIVRLQQMEFQLVKPWKTAWTVSTWVRLCTSVNTNMLLQTQVQFKQLPTVRTIIWSYIAVYTTFMFLQVACLAETFVTQWTLVSFVSSVDSHVIVQICRLTKNHVTHVTFVWFLSTVNSAVLNKTRLPISENRLLQTVHSNSFSPVWVLMCTARALLFPVHLPHSVHLYLLLWIFICIHRPDTDEKHFSHWPHEYTFSPVCLALWAFKCAFTLKDLIHTSQTNSFSLCCVLLRPVNLGLSSALLFIWNELPVRTT